MIQYGSCHQVQKGHKVAFALNAVCKNSYAEILQEPSGEVLFLIYVPFNKITFLSSVVTVFGYTVQNKFKSILSEVKTTSK